jgi:hypothetical protein
MRPAAQHVTSIGHNSEPQFDKSSQVRTSREQPLNTEVRLIMDNDATDDEGDSNTADDLSPAARTHDDVRGRATTVGQPMLQSETKERWYAGEGEERDSHSNDSQSSRSSSPLCLTVPSRQCQPLQDNEPNRLKFGISTILSDDISPKKISASSTSPLQGKVTNRYYLGRKQI